MHRRALRIALLAFIAVWFGLIVPGHRRAASPHPPVPVLIPSRGLMRSRVPLHSLCALLVLVVCFLPSCSARANHGPGASGGASSTISGETLKPGTFELSLREDYSQFEQ